MVSAPLVDLSLPHPASRLSFYIFVLISLPFSSMLLPILVFIFIFSTPRSRRSLLFAVNVLIVLLGIAEGIISTVVHSIFVLQPLDPVGNGLFLAFLGFAFYVPIIVDCVPILRLNAVYPAKLYPSITRVAILSIPIVCSIGRLFCVSIAVSVWANGENIYRSDLTTPFNSWPFFELIILDWSIQLFENIYTSFLFLFRLRSQRALSSRMYRNQTFAIRLRRLFYIALSNFVFPACFSIAQLIYVTRNISGIQGTTILMVNNYVSIIGVLFATLWYGSDVWKSQDVPPELPSFRQSMVTLSGIAPSLMLSLSEHGPRQSPASLIQVGSNNQSYLYGSRLHPFANAAKSSDKVSSKSIVDILSVLETLDTITPAIRGRNRALSAAR